MGSNVVRPTKPLSSSSPVTRTEMSPQLKNQEPARLLAQTSEILVQEDLLHLGGGPEAIARQHEKGRKTARERIAILLDQDYSHRGTLLWRGPLCPLRQGLRPPIPVRVAGGPLRRDGRPASVPDHARRERGDLETTGESDRPGRARPTHRRAATAVRPRDRHPPRRCPALDRRDHRAGADPRGLDPGVRCRHPLPRYPAYHHGGFPSLRG